MHFQFSKKKINLHYTQLSYFIHLTIDFVLVNYFGTPGLIPYFKYKPCLHDFLNNQRTTQYLQNP